MTPPHNHRNDATALKGFKQGTPPVSLFGKEFWMVFGGYIVAVSLFVWITQQGDAMLPIVAGVVLGLMYVGHQHSVLQRMQAKTPKQWHIWAASLIRFIVAAGVIVWVAQGNFVSAGWVLLGFMAQHVALLGAQIGLAIAHARRTSG